MGNLILGLVSIVMGIRLIQFSWWLAFKADKNDPWFRTKRSMHFNRRKTRIEFR